MNTPIRKVIGIKKDKNAVHNETQQTKLDRFSAAW